MSPTLDSVSVPTLADHTTLRVGGRAHSWVVADTEDELIEAVRECEEIGTDLLVLGGGSNLVAADAPFPGTVVQVATSGRSFSPVSEGVLVTLAAGEPWDRVVAEAVASGWSGIEALAGIPGLAGATPIQNVGAYGQEVSQVMRTVRVLDRRSLEVVTLDHAECGFGYRTSIFKEQRDRWLVLSVSLHLSTDRRGTVRYAELARALGVEVGGRADVADVSSAVLDLRRAKGMVLDPSDHDTWSAGSFFTNPIVEDDHDIPDRCPRYPAARGTKLSAAWLIERAGVPRGFRLDETAPAAVSTKHTLALCNRGGATAADVLALAREIQRRVQETFGLRLAIEPTLVGAPG